MKQIRLKNLNMGGLKGRLLDELEDVLALDDPVRVNSVVKVVDTAAKVAGLYQFNQQNVNYEPTSLGKFLIADPYTPEQEAEIRSKAGTNEISIDFRPDWQAGTTSKPFIKQAHIFDAIINSTAKNIVLAIARQYGKTWIGAMTALYYALNYSDFLIIWAVPQHDHILKVLRDFERYLTDAPFQYHLTKSNGNQGIDFLSNRSRIEFRQMHNPQGTRGNTADIVIVDEAAFIDEEAYTKVLMPLTAIKGRKRIYMSSPAGKNWFYQLYLKGQDTEASTIAFTARTADNPLVAASEIELAEKMSPSDAFKQEYLAEFLEDGGAVFRGVPGCIIDVVQPEITKRMYAGIDYGKSNDFTVLTLLNGRGEMVDMHRFQAPEWDDINKKLIGLLKEYPNVKCYVETNGVGSVASYLIKESPKQSIWPWNTNAKSKEKLIQDLQMDLGNGQVKITNNPTLIQEMNMFSFDIVGGHFRYGARAGYHDDCVISLALANQARRNLAK